MPFGLDDALIWAPLIGAIGGGLMNKRDPLKGALLGVAMGYGGGLMAGPGGLLGAAATPTGITAASSAEGLSPALMSSEGLTVGNTVAPSLVSPSMLTTASGAPAQIAAANPSVFKQAMEYAKPIGNIATAANATKGLLSSPQTPLPPITPLPVSTGQGGAQSLSQIVTSNANAGNQIALDAEQRAKRRRQLIGG